MENSQYSSDSNYKRDPRMYSQSRPHRYQNKPESYTRPPRAGGPKLNHDTNEEENGRQSWSQPRFSQNNKYIREGYNDKYQSYEADQNNARKGNIYVYPNSHQPSSNQSYQSNYYPRSKTQHFEKSKDYGNEYSREGDCAMSYEEKKITSEVNPSRPTKVTSTHITFKSPGASAVSNAVPPSPLSTPSTSVHPQVSKPVTSAPETTFSSKIPPATSIQEPQVPSADRALNSLSSILHSHLHNHPYGNAVPLAPPVLPSTSDFSLQSLQSTMGQPSEPDPVSQLNIFLQRNKLPEPVIEFQLAAETPPRFYCNLSVGHATIRTPIPYKSKKEAKRVASELWLNACQAFEHGPPSHKGKTVSYIPENTSSHPNQEPACSNVPVNPQKPEPWSTTLNVFLQKNHLEFPEFHFRQRINGISVEVSSSFIKFSDPQRYKSRKEAKEAVCKKVYEELVKQTQQRDSEVANITSTHLPPRALYAQPFYTSQNPNSFVNPQNPSNPMVAPSFEDMDMDPGEDSIEVKDFIMSTTSPIPPTAYMNSISTKALLQEFCRRGGLQFQLVSEPSCKPTVFEIRVHDLTELAADEDEAARKMLAQLSDLIINASSRD